MVDVDDRDVAADPPDSPTTGVTPFGDLDRAGNEEDGEEEKREREPTSSFRVKDHNTEGDSLAPDLQDIFGLSEVSESETEEEYDNDLPDYPSDTDKEDPKDEDRRASAEKFKNSKLNDGVSPSF